MAMWAWRSGQRAAIQLSKQRPNRSGSTRLRSARSQRSPGMPWWKGEKRRRTARWCMPPGDDVVEIVAGGDGRTGDEQQHLMQGIEHAPRLALVVEGGELRQ